MVAALGIFVTLEGGETVGKTTQARRLAEALASSGREVVTTREPGGSPMSERLRAIVLGGRAGDDPVVEATIFAAARAIHVDRTIRPALDRGAVVVCDRYVDSTRALQGTAGVDEATLEALVEEACDGCVPDLTIVMTLPDDVLESRLLAKAGGVGLDVMEARGRDYHRDVNRRFAAIAADHPGRCVAVEATGSPEEVTARILTVVAGRFPHLLSGYSTPRP